MVYDVENIDILRIFDDKNISSKLKTGLPKLFRIAELESCRAGKIGMEVGSVREKIVIAFLIYIFGEQNGFAQQMAILHNKSDSL